MVEIIEWVPSATITTGPSNKGGGLPVLFVRADQVPFTSVSADNGGGILNYNQNCTWSNNCYPGYKWTWDPTISLPSISSYPEKQTLSFDSQSQQELQAITFTVLKTNSSVQVPLPTIAYPASNTTGMWADVDGMGWDAGLELLKVTWGTPMGPAPVGYVEMNAYSDETELESLFTQNVLTSKCQWVPDSHRVFYDYLDFESADSGFWGGGDSGKENVY